MKLKLTLDVEDDADSDEIESRLNTTWWVWQSILTHPGNGLTVHNLPDDVDPQPIWDEAPAWHDVP